MAKPTTKAELSSYCLRELGAPVTQINVADEQVDDRIDEGLKKFFEFHMDGQERKIMQYKVTSDDIALGYIDTTKSSFDPNNLIMSVNKVYQHTTFGSAEAIFDPQYQLAQQNLSSWANGSLVNYDMAMQYLGLVQDYLTPEWQYTHSKYGNKLTIHINWAEKINVGDYLLIDVYVRLNEDTAGNHEIFNDEWLKKYCTALIERQWGRNLTKYSGIQMLNGVEMNGEAIFQRAQEEITRLEEELRLSYELPIDFFVG